jgi:rubrerythrin
MNTRNVVLSFLKTSSEKEQYDKLLKHMEKNAMDFTSISPILEPGNALDERELVRAIRLSISAEEDAASLYELIADAADDKTVKKVVQDIANEEKVHCSEFMAILKKLDDKEIKYINEGEEEIKDIVR